MNIDKNRENELCVMPLCCVLQNGTGEKSPHLNASFEKHFPLFSISARLLFCMMYARLTDVMCTKFMFSVRGNFIVAVIQLVLNDR